MHSLRWAILICLIASPAARALEPAEILLIANGNAPVSKQLAEYYAEKRHVPVENLVLLDLPAQEEIKRAEYVDKIARPVRAFLEKNDAHHKIKCLLTFTGVPIRVSNRPTSAPEREELALVQAELKLVLPEIIPRVQDLEAIAKDLDPTYKPVTELKELAALNIRVEHAVQRILQRLNAERDPAARRVVLEQLFDDMDPLTGPSGRMQRVMFADLPLDAPIKPPTTFPTTFPTEVPSSKPATHPSAELGGSGHAYRVTQPTTQPEGEPRVDSATRPVVPFHTGETVKPATKAPEKSLAGATTKSADKPSSVDTRSSPSTERRALLAQAQERVAATALVVQQMAAHQDNPETRARLRLFVREQLGLLTYARLLDSQNEILNSSETGSAVDNELALVEWGDDYGLYRWIESPMYFKNVVRMAGLPPVMMVMRLDGPQDATVRDIIVSSLQAEEKGLGGKVVIDSRGIAARKEDGSIDNYGTYDETLRNLDKLLKEKTKLEVVFDDQPAVLRAGSVKDVGIYIGWYAVRNYIPTSSFRPGAVGFHVASLEMISLKSAGERGWVAGLLNDGIAATLGAVNEPYLHSFPRADEFFPLLMTGKLTLAEVYWRTNPLVSWQISMIGDPLYTPFKKNPAIKEDDLPPGLRVALHQSDRSRPLPTTAPAATSTVVPTPEHNTMPGRR